MGVPVDPVCADPTCTGDVACSAVVTVSDASALAGASASATAGTCIALAPGSYGAATLPAGVSLLGRGADFVTVAGIDAQAGGATVRGVTVGAGGLTVSGAGAFSVAGVRVGGATGDGISAKAGVSLSVHESEVLSAQGVALRADGATDLVVHGFVVDGTNGPGLAALCDDGCACTSTATIERTLVREATHVGMFLRGVGATIDGLEIGGTQVDGLEPSSGGGLVVAGCAEVEASHMNVHDNAFFGALVDSSVAHFGSPGEEDGIIIHANVLGVWFQGKDAGGEVGGADISGNQGVGLGASGQTKGIIIHASQIRDTTKKVLVVFGGGSEEVGDGLLWSDGAEVEVDDVVVSNSARQPVLIDGAVAAGSSIAHLTLEGSDAGKSILQQNLPSGGLSPTLGAATPAIDAQAAAVLAVPVAPQAPATP